jgi:hypothetical protein
MYTLVSIGLSIGHRSAIDRHGLFLETVFEKDDSSLETVYREWLKENSLVSNKPSEYGMHEEEAGRERMDDDAMVSDDCVKNCSQKDHASLETLYFFLL